MQCSTGTAETLPLLSNRDALTDVLRQGAQRMLATAIDARRGRALQRSSTPPRQ